MKQIFNKIVLVTSLAIIIGIAPVSFHLEKMVAVAYYDTHTTTNRDYTNCGPNSLSVTTNKSSYAYHEFGSISWSLSGPYPNTFYCRLRMNGTDVGAGNLGASGNMGEYFDSSATVWTINCYGPGPGYSTGSGNCLSNNQTVLASKSITTTVAPPPPPAPSGTVTASDCSITAGNSSCTTSLSWSVSNPTSGAYTNVTSPTGTTPVPPTSATSTAVSGSSNPSVTIPNGSRTFYLYHNGSQLNQKTVTASCIANTSWDITSGKCVAPPPAGTLTVKNISAGLPITSCVIPIGSSSCDVALSWSVTNPIAGKLTNVTIPTNNQIGTGNTGSIASYPVPYGSLTFFLNHNGTTFTDQSKTIVAACTPGTAMWDTVSGKCVGLPDLKPSIPTWSVSTIIGSLKDNLQGRLMVVNYNKVKTLI